MAVLTRIPVKDISFNICGDIFVRVSASEFFNVTEITNKADRE